MRRGTKDYYRILGIPRNADAKTVKKAYHRMAKRYHPDRNPGDKAAENRFKDINEAYEVLSSPAKRAKYDQILRYQATGFDFIERMARKAGRAGAAGIDLDELKRMFTGAAPRGRRTGKGGPGGRGAGRNRRGAGDGGAFGKTGGGILDDLGISGFGDVLDLIFDRAPESGGTAKPRKTRGEDIHFAVTIDHEQARRGGETVITLPLEETCRKCGGSGARAGTKSPPCPECGGKGEIPQNLGTFAIKRPCTACLGRGRIVAEPCPECSGTGTCSGTRRVAVKIPAGTGDGSRIRLRKLGRPGPGGPGDLILKVTVMDGDASAGRGDREDPVPGEGGTVSESRGGDDALEAGEVAIEINPVTALLGGKARVDVPGGGSFRIDIPPGTNDGRLLRLRGAAPGGGDLSVRVRVTGEERLSERARELMKTLRDEEGDR